MQAANQNEAPSKTHDFCFDWIFSMDSEQKDIYDFTAKPIIESKLFLFKGVLDGFNGTVFAYGQTGSGKTFTMQGNLDDPWQQGIVPWMVWTVFEWIEQASESVEFTVKVSMMEIYCENLKDLLNPSKDKMIIK